MNKQHLPKSMYYHTHKQMRIVYLSTLNRSGPASFSLKREAWEITWERPLNGSEGDTYAAWSFSANPPRVWRGARSVRLAPSGRPLPPPCRRQYADRRLFPFRESAAVFRRRQFLCLLHRHSDSHSVPSDAAIKPGPLRTDRRRFQQI